MYNNHAEAEDYDAPRSSDNIFSRLKRSLMGHDDWEDEEEEHDATAAQQPSPQPRAGSPFGFRRPTNGLRLEHARPTHVMVRRSVQSFDDARRSADGLKSGEPQIVNLEQTPNDMAERIIDFLNGATYALDGSVEKIGEQVYLFTPATILIDVEEKPAPGTRVAFLDRP
jgi:cell division inhibitor SepF